MDDSSGLTNQIKSLLRAYKFSRYIGLPKRLFMVLTNGIPVLIAQVRWCFRTIEYTNFPYTLDEFEIKRLAHFVSSALRVPYTQVREFFEEIDNDKEFKKELRSNFNKSRIKGVSSSSFTFGRRYAWYAIVRILRPNIVIETGTDKGLGAAILSLALKKNGSGELFTVDTNPESGPLINSPYFRSNVHLVHETSSEFLKSFNRKIDFFIHDSDHSFENESLEYELISSKLAEKGLVASDNSGLSNALDLWSINHGRFFHYFEENSPEYPGKTSGLGLSILNDN